VAAREWFDARGYRYEWIDVEANPADYDAMIRLSGQTKTPTLVTSGGNVLPDFGTDELEAFVRKHDLKP
jgi:glutaredoxin